MNVIQEMTRKCSIKSIWQKMKMLVVSKHEISVKQTHQFNQSSINACDSLPVLMITITAVADLPILGINMQWWSVAAKTTWKVMAAYFLVYDYCHRGADWSALVAYTKYVLVLSRGPSLSVVNVRVRKAYIYLYISFRRQRVRRLRYRLCRVSAVFQLWFIVIGLLHATTTEEQ